MAAIDLPGSSDRHHDEREDHLRLGFDEEVLFVLRFLRGMGPEDDSVASVQHTPDFRVAEPIVLVRAIRKSARCSVSHH